MRGTVSDLLRVQRGKLPENGIPLTIALAVMALSALIVVMNLGPDPDPEADSGGPLARRPPDAQAVPPPGAGLIGEEAGRDHLTIRARSRPIPPIDGQALEAGSARLEVDVFAEGSNPMTLPTGDFVPYLQLTYRIEPPQGGQPIDEGPLKPTLASGGFHYGAVVHPPPGHYKLVLKIGPPGDTVARSRGETDSTPAWWEPFSVSFPYDFPPGAEPNP